MFTQRPERQIVNAKHATFLLAGVWAGRRAGGQAGGVHQRRLGCDWFEGAIALAVAMALALAVALAVSMAEVLAAFDDGGDVGI